MTGNTAAALITASFRKFKNIKSPVAPRPSPYMVNRQPDATAFRCSIWELKILRRALRNAMGKRTGGGCPEFAALEARIDAQVKNLVG